MWHLKTTTMPVIMRDLGMINKWADKNINSRHGSASLYEIKNVLFAGLLISWADGKKKNRKIYKYK